MSESQTQLTRETYDRLRAELEELTTHGRTEIARLIQAARELGDLSENGDYHAAKDSQGKMEARIRQLEAMLKDPVIVEASDVTTDKVAAGTVVEIRFEGEDDTEKYFVGSIEEKREGIEVVSLDSPLGQALLGKGTGEVVEYKIASGAVLKAEVVGISS